jgi:hypothetical protein
MTVNPIRVELTNMVVEPAGSRRHRMAKREVAAAETLMDAATACGPPPARRSPIAD